MEIQDIINNVKNIVSEYDTFKVDDLEQLEKNCLYLFNDYIKSNILNIYNYNFDKELTEYVYKNILGQLEPLFKVSNKYRIRKRVKKIINKIRNKIYKNQIPYRSYSKSFVRNIVKNVDKLKKNIIKLDNTYQPEQRTEEWYEFRHSLITASSLWKIFGSPSQQNQIIYEKCEPYKEHVKASTESPLHWGQKYEPISQQLYELKYNTKISEYGCIRHNKYSFIGASPDGINTKLDNDRYGRMLEIKNIVNREITGIPKFEYWIQMQIQMETCKLDECDFLETKFIEYECYNDFINDGSFNLSNDNKEKGIIIQFNGNNGIYYEYPPLNLNSQEFELWENGIKEKNYNDQWIQNIYWKLDIFSNVLVLRNQLWFESAIPKIKEIWNIIENEKINGYEHRAPKKRKALNKEQPKKCLINVEKLES